jgi:hypothetical protein
MPQLDFITFLCQGGAVFCFSWAFYIFLKSEALPILYRISNFRQRVWIIISKSIFYVSGGHTLICYLLITFYLDFLN